MALSDPAPVEAASAIPLLIPRIYDPLTLQASKRTLSSITHFAE